ncbi:MAG TPA: LapA family protein [Leptolyngbyaceae cyanobacterium M33_DOE_097]|uniref:LapA family protein n=1 Tax=Oscillatoriales cyanobacterium SpSt-418 TaxID=2282169 RepID=A0A7C3PFJ2_9CYAN|nr:LapA family protein [Leptolyngbyaceae cyanobacterium M33_DOE_097]
MKRLASLLLSAIAAIWIAVIAIVSVQNYTPVTLRFFTYQSIQVPLGLVLAFSISFGVLGAALLVPLTGQAGSQDDDPL